MPGNLILIGFSGSGKSRVGRALAERLARPFVDTDEQLVGRFGMAIGDVFRRLGEPAFRDAETEEVRAACARAGAVVALGGGSIVRPENLAAARAGNTIIRLRASLDTLYRRLTEQPGAEERPMLAGSDPKARIEALLAARETIYAEADVTIDTDTLTIENVVDAVCATLPATSSRSTSR